MCYCNPNVRTPCCGGPDCHPKECITDQERNYIIETYHEDPKNTHEILVKQSQLALWQSYCDKKQECEILWDKLELALEMLRYSHTTSETYYDRKRVYEFVTDMNNFMKEKSNGY